MWAVTSGSPPFWVGCIVLAAVGVALAAGRRSRWAGLVALVLIACLTVGGLRVWSLSQSVVAGLASEGAAVTLELVIDGDPYVGQASGSRPPYVAVPASVLRVEGRGLAWSERGRVRLLAGSPDDWRIPVGSVVSALGRLQPADPEDGLAAVVRIQSRPQVLRPPEPGMVLVERLRSGLRTSMQAEGGDRGALVPALVLGDTSGLPPDLTDAMRETGLTHLAAVSGANLTLLLAFVLTAARWCGVRGWWLRIVAGATVAGFVVLCRAEPSVIRAAAMGLVALAGLSGGHRDAAGPRNLSVAVFGLMLLDPWLAHSVGFQLSVVATAGILGLASRWATALGWLPHWLAEALSIPLAAQVATQPLVTAISGRVSLAGILANALAGPAVGPATVLGLATAVLALVGAWAAALPAWAAGWCAQSIVWIAQFGAALPGATMNWPTSPAALGLLACLSVVAAVFGAAVLRRSWLVLAAAGLLVLALTRPPLQPGWPPSDWVFVACDVGQGDALVARVGPGQGLLIDAGPEAGTLQQCLAGLGIEALPLVVLTHFHADHAAGVQALISSGLVGRLLLPATAAGQGRSRVVASAQLAGVPITDAGAGQVLQIGDAVFRTVAAGPPGGPDRVGEGESAAENDASVVGVLEVGGLRVLTTGDIEESGQRAVLASGASLACDVLKVAHHGSSRQDPAFLAATGAKVALISVGERNDYGHPAPRTLKALLALGMLILRTDQQGSIAVSVRSGRLELVTQK